MGRQKNPITLRNEAKGLNKTNYFSLERFAKIVNDFKIIPDEELEELFLFSFNDIPVKAVRLNDQVCMALFQCAKYVNTSKDTIKKSFKRHKHLLKKGLDYFKRRGQNVPTYYLTLRGILKLLKFIHVGFADDFYEDVVDYVCDNIAPITKKELIFKPLIEESEESKYGRWRMGVLLRDNFTCRLCNKTHSRVAHHINDRNYFPELQYEIDNGLCVCEDCHDKIHQRGKYRNDE